MKFLPTVYSFLELVYSLMLFLNYKLILFINSEMQDVQLCQSRERAPAEITRVERRRGSGDDSAQQVVI